ncbi:Na/Pi cotransporter family protein [Paracoccus sp. P2]|uniref:Na/Pi cotransporter family protein n=1 Tax=Paracoccus pantotrophus TaxID=82367 RepID=A0A454NRF0_PARPN|nr:Na/Pi cotransporter family protein [Paracoccus pantotrophus]QFG37918.1 Na/Pi cotransporter family protein [Paracoccus pantotrophus]QLH15472.1 Na/Pi cotransporter family protein [Paracoccus pantotrophus]RDD99199.1 Na/Pi cotransporter family protein [Paracoccus pantotrophus]RKS51599.1 phosphate:Na+ symporter [Paracoccus pantotrophus]RNI20231.1 Na/Pi cotransporter family protein [Paracoccus pantotrophus]
MQSLSVMFQLAGAVALLLFGLGLVRDGMVRAFGVRLKMALGRGTRTGLRAFVSGLVATLGLQSSTATALMTASFVDRGMIRPRMAQIVLLGANLGTALTAWIVASGIEALVPVLLLAGYAMRGQSRRGWSGGGLALIGIALMLLSLGLLGHATEPLRESAAMAAFLAMLGNAWPVALAIAAGLAVICSSSLAVVMLVLSLAMDPALTVVLVLGANLGGAIPPVLATAGQGIAARRVALGNLVVRAVGCLVALPLAGQAAQVLTAVPLPETGLAVEAHLAFNLALAAAIWPFSALVTRLTGLILREDETPPPIEAQLLDGQALDTPAVALARASRAALAIGDVVERMLQQARTAFARGDDAPLAEVSVLEERVDRMQQEVKSFLSRLGREAGEDERRQAITILDYVINLEHVGDIIDKGLGPEIRKKAALALRFSDEGYRELDGLFLMTIENLRLAQTVFMTRDRDLARQLMEEKVEIRRLERMSAQRHLMRLREGRADSQQTSSLHLDILRDLKRVNAHIVSVAHPILDEADLLIESRLKRG